MSTTEKIQLAQTFGIYLTFLAAVLAIFFAWIASTRQNQINEKISNIQDTVELYATAATMQSSAGELVSVIHVQNIGNRLVYFDRYIFNGKEYDLGGHVRPSTYSQADNNFYWIELPRNGENHVSVTIYFTDVEGRQWKSKIMADLINNSWKVATFPREQVN